MADFVATLAYDAAGNTTADDDGRTLVYDAWNRLVRVVDADGVFVTSYAYDGIGRRIAENRLDVSMVADIAAGVTGSNPANVTAVGSIVFFTANDGTNGTELWKTDGTKAGTELVKDIRSGATGSNPGGLVNISGTLYFSADDGSNGRELWKSDGTTGGTVRITNINSGSGSSNPSVPVLMGSKLYFAADDGSNGYELWSCNTDGSSAALVGGGGGVNSGGDGMVPGNTQLAVISSTLYFFADDGSGGTELFSTDGSAITKVDPSAVDPNYELYDQMAVIGSTLFFVGSNATYGKELFKVVSGSISVVKNIRSSSNSSDPGNLTVMNGVLYFTANNGTNGVELWKSDGSDGGTTLVKDIRAGSASSSPYYLTVVDSTLFFLADDGTSGTELWKSDGTTNGTVIVKDIRAGALTSSPTELVTDGTTLYFRADDGVHGHELWKSDGSGGGTVLVKDIFGASGAPYNLAVADGELYFVGNDGLHGAELWRLPAGEDYRDVYFSANWQAIEERINGEATASTQIVYSMVYVDAQVLRDTFVSGSFSQRLYVQQDANQNVTAILAYDEGEEKWVVVERYLYDPYGNVTVCNEDYSVKGDGTPASSDFGWLFFHQGGEYDPKTGLYLFRNRHYSPSLMRWIQEDPAQFGLNMYEGFAARPADTIDPLGLWPWDNEPDPGHIRDQRFGPVKPQKPYDPDNPYTDPLQNRIYRGEYDPGQNNIPYTSFEFRDLHVKEVLTRKATQEAQYLYDKAVYLAWVNEGIRLDLEVPKPTSADVLAVAQALAAAITAAREARLKEQLGPVLYFLGTTLGDQDSAFYDLLSACTVSKTQKPLRMARVPKRGGMIGVNQHKVREGISKDWKVVDVDKGSGWKAVDPNGIERIRFMRPNPDGRFQHEKVGYWRFQDAKGNFLDQYGKVKTLSDPDFHVETHIPYSGVRK